MGSFEKLCLTGVNCLLGGEWTFEAIVFRLEYGLKINSKRERWYKSFIERVLTAFPTIPKSLHDRIKLESFLKADRGFIRAIKSPGYKQRAIFLPTPPLSVFADKGVQKSLRFQTRFQLSEFLGITPQQLKWYADVDGREHLTNKSKWRNYRYQRIKKRNGGSRLVEAPKSRLKEIQRLILNEIVYSIPPHDAAHGFCPQRSIETFVEGHVGQQVVMRIDLRHFFPSIHHRKVAAVFRSVGFSPTVSRTLTGLCTNTTWQGALLEPFETDGAKHLAIPHLPQGAPTSPALANLCAFRLDCRLSGLAKKFGGFYTRYADDLVFSGDRYFQNRLSRIRIFAGAICLNEGFTIRRRKTRVMPASTRQCVAGVVVNQKLATGRREFDELKATLFNCVRYGLESQNRNAHANFRDHLRGRIEWVRQMHPKRGQKLLDLFEQIST